MKPKQFVQTLARSKSRGLAVVVILVVFQVTLLAQTTVDVIYLKNGSVIRGTIIEQIVGETVKIQTRDGSIFSYKMDEMLRISKENSTPSASSQDASKADLYIAGGLALPSGPEDFRDNWNLGLNLGGGIGFSLSSAVSIAFSGEYAFFPIDETEMLKKAGASGTGVSVTIDGGTLSILTLAGNVKLLLIPTPGSTAPYFVAGAGFFSLSASDARISASYLGSSSSVTVKFDNESAFYASVGAGMDIPMNEKTSVFFEGRYSIGFTKGENTSYIPIKAGIRIGF